MNVKSTMRTLFAGMIMLASAGAALAQEAWISESEMKRLSADARSTGEVLTDLKCKFQDVASPNRSHVLFQPTFQQGDGTVPWGWTYEANAPNPRADAQAERAGFKLVSEDYFEITGVTFVRCKVWQR